MNEQILRSAVITAVAFLTSGICQSAQADRWKGLVLGEATAEQAIKTVGLKPEADETGRFMELGKQKLFDRFALPGIVEPRKDEVLRVMRFSGVEGFKAVSLAFRADKLVMIQLVPEKQNKILASDLESLYDDCHFRFVPDSRDMWTKSFGVDPNSGELRPKNYEVFYLLLGASKRSGIIAQIENQPGFAQLIGGADRTRPGKVFRLSLLDLSLLPPRRSNKTLE